MNEQLEGAIELIESGKHEAGLKKVEELSLTADDDGKRTIAELYYELGLVDRALQMVEELMFRYPDHGELFAFAAECYMELGKEDEALEMLTEIHEEDAAFVQAQLLLADVYQNQGMDEVAETKLLQAEKLTSGEPVILYGLGEFYLSRGDYQQSIPYFKKVIHDEKFLNEHESINPYLRIAEAYSATGQFEDSLAYYKQGIDKDEDISGLFGYGYTALQLEEYETTVKQFTRLIELDPDYTTVYPYLAKALRSLHRMDEAIEILQWGIKKDEYNEELYLEMAETQFQIGNLQEGKSYLEKVVAINPSNSTAVKELLLFFYENEDYEDILELLSFLDSYDEYDPLYERFKAKALYEEDDLDNALKAYDIAINEYDKDEELMEEAAFAYIEAGEKEKGQFLLMKLLKLAPERFDIEERLNNL